MLIAIEGCMGAGKTTVAQGLAARRLSMPLLEAFELNPFLRAFSQDPVRFAFETEFTFLMIHLHQLKCLGTLAATSEIVADFHVGKDLIYADLNLSDGRAKSLFRELYEVGVEPMPQPELMILLAAPDELLHERIRLRDRDFELKLAPSYFASLNAAYERWYGQYPGRKMLIDMNDWDFVRDPALFDKLSEAIDRTLSDR